MAPCPLRSPLLRMCPTPRRDIQDDRRRFIGALLRVEREEREHPVLTGTHIMKGTVARTPTAYLIAVLALLQAALGVLRLTVWFQLGGAVMGHPHRLHPIFGIMLIVRGTLIAGIAALYAAFAWGTFRGQSWARPIGIAAAALNLVLALALVIREQFSMTGLLWCVVPVVVLCYLLPQRRR